MTFFSRSGSLSPAAWMTMRSLPWRAMSGSLVPIWSIRRRMTSMFCSTALAASASKASGTKAMRMRWSAGGVDRDVTPAGRAGQRRADGLAQRR